MINRYKNQKISYIWDDQNKFDTWKKVQETYVKTLEEEGVAKPGISEKIASVSVEAEEVYEREKVTNHGLASFVDILRNKVGEGSNWIHYGLTSSDVVDTSNSLFIKESLELLLKLVDDLLNEIKNSILVLDNSYNYDYTYILYYFSQTTVFKYLDISLSDNYKYIVDISKNILSKCL